MVEVDHPEEHLEILLHLWLRELTNGGDSLGERSATSRCDTMAQEFNPMDAEQALLLLHHQSVGLEC